MGDESEMLGNGGRLPRVDQARRGGTSGGDKETRSK